MVRLPMLYKTIAERPRDRPLSSRAYFDAQKALHMIHLTISCFDDFSVA